MDLEESFASAPVRYALDDVDSDEELEMSLNIDKVSVVVETTESLDSGLNLVIGLNGPGNVYIHSLEGEKLKTIGSVIRKVRETGILTLLYSKTNMETHSSRIRKQRHLFFCWKARKLYSYLLMDKLSLKKQVPIPELS